MDGRDSTQSLLVLRKLTRAIAEVVRGQMTEYLATLAPLLRPRVVLGDYVEGGTKESTKRADKAFKELQALWASVPTGRPYSLARELTTPIRFQDLGLEITPVEYAHTIQDGTATRTITVRSPLAWTLSYAGFAPSKLPELLKTKLKPGEELQQFLLSHLLLHVVATNLPGVLKVAEALHFPITSHTMPEYGTLPFTRIGIGIGTFRPSDEVVLQTAELTGVDAFEEVVNVNDIANIGDPFKSRLLEIAAAHLPSQA